MYMPAHFEETDTGVLQALVDAHPLATWIAQVMPDADAGASGDAMPDLQINHIPFMLDRSRGLHGTLVGHVARTNPVWKRPSRGVMVFQGPQAYISPGWYASKREHGKVVPTWNYAVVHAHGQPRAIEDKDALLALVTKLTATHEAKQTAPWQVSDAPETFIDQMLRAIVGIEMPIERLVGKWKVSQNRSAADRAGTAAALRASADSSAAAMGDLTAEYARSGVPT